MNEGKLQRLIQSMDPMEAAAELADAAKGIFSHLGEEALRDFLAKLIGEEGQDKVTGLVHL
jgi:hypothetical protein